MSSRTTQPASRSRSWRWLTLTAGSVALACLGQSFPASARAQAAPLQVVFGGKQVRFRAEGCILRPNAAVWIVVPERPSETSTCALVETTVYTQSAASFYLPVPLTGRTEGGAAASGFPVKGAAYEVVLVGANFSGKTVNGTGTLTVLDVRGRKVDAVLRYEPTDWDRSEQGITLLGGRFSAVIEPHLPAFLP